MKDIQIPPEALEAAARAIFGPGGLSGGIREVHLNTVRAAFLAMLENWPDAVIGMKWPEVIVLPLPKETSDE